MEDEIIGVLRFARLTATGRGEVCCGIESKWHSLAQHEQHLAAEIRKALGESATEYAIQTARGHYYRYAGTWGLAEIRADQKITGEPGDVLVSRTVTRSEWQEVDDE